MKVVEADVLFGDGRNLTVAQSAVYVSSPAMRPSLSVNTMKHKLEDPNDLWTRIESNMEWDLRSPESIELDELDIMLDDF